MAVIKIPFGPKSAEAAEWLKDNNIWFSCYRDVSPVDFTTTRMAFVIDDEAAATEFALRWL